jgi:hypothetical protein
MKIKAVQEPWNDSLGVLFYENGGQDRYIVKPIQLTLEKVEPGTDVNPTFSIPGRDIYDFLKSMAEIAEANGIRTDTQAQEEIKNKGVLESTKYHLEDMRKLVFKETEE